MGLFKKLGSELKISPRSQKSRILFWTRPFEISAKNGSSPNDKQFYSLLDQAFFESVTLTRRLHCSLTMGIPLVAFLDKTLLGYYLSKDVIHFLFSFASDFV